MLRCTYFTISHLKMSPKVLLRYRHVRIKVCPLFEVLDDRWNCSTHLSIVRPIDQL